MTKPITSIGVMILADEGKLSVEDPVEKYLPEFQGQMLVMSRSGDTITLKKPPRRSRSTTCSRIRPACQTTRLA